MGTGYLPNLLHAGEGARAPWERGNQCSTIEGSYWSKNKKFHIYVPVAEKL